MKTIAIIGECMIELNGTPFGTMQQTYGGDTLNTATYLARNTARDTLRVDYISALGTDPLSREMRVRWEADGIDTRHVHTDPAHSPGLYLIQLDADGERTFLYWRNNSAARHLLQQPAWPQTAAALANYDHLYLSGISLAILPPADREHLIDILNTSRVPITFDGNYRPALWKDPAETRTAYARLLPHVQLALMTWDDEQALWGDADPEAAIRRLQQAGVREIVLKNGAAARRRPSRQLRTRQPPRRPRHPAQRRHHRGRTQPLIKPLSLWGRGWGLTIAIATKTALPEKNISIDAEKDNPLP